MTAGSGRRTRTRCAHRPGLAEAACSARAITREQADGWIAEQRARAESDRLFLAVPMFVAAATAPR
ncbi:hypothetical protein ACFYVL_34595 [Streptomyces sp. NPDC004111]|uniref:hypothetical protein n=1 Tax=Streptomyces sp. NPDC004111 TaxID=3364690 RepID=UPI003698B2AC